MPGYAEGLRGFQQRLAAVWTGVPDGAWTSTIGS